MTSPTPIVMLLSNAFRPDPRVLKEAGTLARDGYALTVIAWDREGRYPAVEQVDAGKGAAFTVRRVQTVRSSYGAGLAQALRLPRFWLAAWRQLNQLRPAVVHCHDFDTLPPGWLWAKLHRRVVIYDAHEYYTELQRPRLGGSRIGKLLLRLIGAAEQTLSRTSSAVVTVDERIARRYRNHRVVVIGHYPPPDFASPPVAGHSAATTLVYAGRFSTDRGLLVIAAALQRLAEQGLHPRVRLLGAWTDPAEQQAFAVATRGLEGQIEHAGWVPFEQIAAQLQQCDIALAVLQPIPRYVAALPVKLFEYMACGLPVVISDFPANREVVATADCGLLVDPANVDAVSEALARLLADPAEAHRLGENGRRAFETRYNWQALEPRLLSLYAQISR
ncbi:MAG: glycosyltransferase family 4 protein [Anaerolineae bacterium]